MGEEDLKEDKIELGSSIELVGFSKIDGGSMVVLKKIIGNHVKKFSEKVKKFERIIITMKPVHEREKGEIYELHSRIIADGKPVTAETSDRNLFYAIDKIMKKLEKETI